MPSVASRLYEARRHTRYGVKIITELAQGLPYDVALDQARTEGEATIRWLDEAVENAEDGVYEDT
jgi:queuine/archaeosine tRNA-ribosyltransferase